MERIHFFFYLVNSLFGEQGGCVCLKEQKQLKLQELLDVVLLARLKVVVAKGTIATTTSSKFPRAV